MNPENPFKLIERPCFKDGPHWLSPDRNREFLLIKNGQGGWLLILSNLGYPDPKHKRAPQRRTVFSLDVSFRSGTYFPTSIGLEALLSPNNRVAVHVFYSGLGLKTRGSQDTAPRSLADQLNRGLRTEASLPKRINMAATAAGFVQKVIKGDFSDPILVPYFLKHL